MQKQHDFDDRFRAEFLTLFRLLFYIGFVTIIVHEIASLFTVLYVSQDLLKTKVGFVEVVRLLQLSLGLLIGFFVMFLGLLAAWAGIQSNTQLAGSVKNEGIGPSAQMTLATSSPGVLMIICGTIIVMVCLTKNVGASQEVPPHPPEQKSQTLVDPS